MNKRPPDNWAEASGKWADVAGKLVEKLPFQKLDRIGVVVIFYAGILAGILVVVILKFPPSYAFCAFVLTMACLLAIFWAFYIYNSKGG
jgi:uncharacterized membrane protein YqjE